MGSVLASVEVFNPLTGTWSTIAPMTSAHMRPVSAFLLDGRLLIAGGYDENWNPSVSTDLYDPGLGFSQAWRPVIDEAVYPMAEGNKLTLEGSGFRGFQYTDASGSGTYSTPSNLPVVRIYRLDNGLVKYISPESFDAQNYSSKALWGLQSTPALITVYVNGIPSVSRMVNAGDMLLRVYLPFLIR